jgi:hypothetical protein
VAKRQPCQEPDCERTKWAPRHRCMWHALLQMPIDEQIGYAEKRAENARAVTGFAERARVPAAEWPEGERWCAGCQSMIPAFYAQGSRCKACASLGSYSSHLKAAYGITYDDYKALLDWQGGRCYICRRQPKKKRLAVDHDHVTGEVRGLLCTDGDRGCNHAILGNITSLDMARRVVSYLETPPLRALRAGQVAPDSVLKANPVVQGRIAGGAAAGKPEPPVARTPWADGVEYDRRKVDAASRAGMGLNAAMDQVPRGSRDDITDLRHPYYEGEKPFWDAQGVPGYPSYWDTHTWPDLENASQAAPSAPVELRRSVDAEWDALTL